MPPLPSRPPGFRKSIVSLSLHAFPPFSEYLCFSQHVSKRNCEFSEECFERQRSSQGTPPCFRAGFILLLRPKPPEGGFRSPLSSPIYSALPLGVLPLFFSSVSDGTYFTPAASEKKNPRRNDIGL